MRESQQHTLIPICTEMPVLCETVSSSLLMQQVQRLDDQSAGRRGQQETSVSQLLIRRSLRRRLLQGFLYEVRQKASYNAAFRERANEYASTEIIRSTNARSNPRSRTDTATTKSNTTKRSDTNTHSTSYTNHKLLPSDPIKLSAHSPTTHYRPTRHCYSESC